jgi:phospholipase/carboxylesterase
VSTAVDLERGIAALGPAVLGALEALETAQRHLHPPALPRLREALAPVGERLEAAREDWRDLHPPADLEALHAQLGLAAERAVNAFRLLGDAGPAGDPMAGVGRVLGAFREHARALEAIYPLHAVLPPVSRFFLEPALRERWRDFERPHAEGASVGLHRAGDDGPDARGGFRLYVPETHEPGRAAPLVVALHGGSGTGRDFLWTWLREARSRGCLLLAPTARGTTWPLYGPDLDAASLASMLEFVAERWAVDRERVLLTGLSDGATYTLLCGLGADSPFSALAPLSGVLHPANFANGNLERARGRRIYLVHGALDWMFPVGIARAARDELERAGADLVYRELDDLSHTYAREENARILDWLGAPAA